jgi:hypothetical protein
LSDPHKANFLRKVQKVLEVHEDEVLTFTTSTLAQTMLPHRDPGDIPAYIRQAGNLTLTIQPQIVPNEKGGYKNYGIPYGTVPRLLLLWLLSEAVVSRSREIPLGDSLTGFMKNLDMVPTGGKWGTIGRLKEQVRRLFSAKFSFINPTPHGEHLANITIVDEYYLFWHEYDPNQGTIFQSKVILTEKFFNELLRAPVPLDLRIVKILKQSPLALDIYTWLTYRMSYLNKPSAPIPWDLLSMQFGSDYKAVRDFKINFLKTLHKVIDFYPATTKPTEKGLVLLPSRTSIAKKPR